MPKLSEVLFGKKAKNKQLKTVTPEQEQLMSLIKQGLTKGTGPLADIFGGFNQEAFEQGVTQPALKNFKENILPLIQEKFIAQNQVGGSGMQNAGLKAGTDLQSHLAQLMYQAMQGQKQNAMQGVNTLLGTRAFENLYKPGNKGLLQGTWEGFAQGLGQGLGGSAAGGIGGLSGLGGGTNLGTGVEGISNVSNAVNKAAQTQVG